MPNLWGVIPKGAPRRTAFTILKEQADLLSAETGGLLIGHAERIVVQQQQARTETDRLFPIQARLSIFAPAVGNYQFRVLTVRYGPGGYPALLSDETGTTFEEPVKCDAELHLVNRLGEIMSSPRVTDAIDGLMAQSREEE